MPEEIIYKESNFIENKIFHIRGVPVMLDTDLAELYHVETKVLNQAVKRNLGRFPEMFLFRLDENDWHSLRSQIVTLKMRLVPFFWRGGLTPPSGTTGRA